MKSIHPLTLWTLATWRNYLSLTLGPWVCITMTKDCLRALDLHAEKSPLIGSIT